LSEVKKQTELIENSALKDIVEALRLQYEGYSITRDSIVNPLTKVVEYIYDAHQAHLTNKEQCSYAGSVLVDATLEEMHRRFASDVVKANKVYLAGIKLANLVWRRLDEVTQTQHKTPFATLGQITDQIVEAACRAML